MTRLIRALLLLLTLAHATDVAAQRTGLGPRDVDRLPSRPADARVVYGTDDALQFGELRLPAGRGPFPVAVVIHGGCWVSRFATLQNTAAFADALRDAGVATWNIEYRRLDHRGGGWPGTFADVAAAADFVAALAKQHPLDASRVVAVGHSAGAHLALWLAARQRLPEGNVLRGDAPLRLNGAVALGGPGDLGDFRTYASKICGGPVIDQLLGGTPQDVPDRYAQTSPVALLPFGTRQVLIVGENDPVMPARARDAYVAAALKAGDTAESIVIPAAGHFEVIAPTSSAWPVVRDKVLELAKGVSPGGGPDRLDRTLVGGVVESLAAVVDREYFDSRVAADAARLIRGRQSQGRYAAARTLGSLAETLTQDLFEATSDKHLAVRVAQAPPSQAPQLRDDERSTRARRVNYGVQRAEVLAGNVGYLNLTSFYRLEEARDTISAAMHLLRSADALIVDMRENSGGSPDTVAWLAGHLFETVGLPLFEITSRAGSTRVYGTPDPGVEGRNERRPVYVLTASGTFSAGEGFAFLLQERGRAEVIGERTAGAANPGRPYAVSGGLEVTVPNGQVRSAVRRSNWEGTGVSPEVPVAPAQALAEAHRRALRALIERAPAGPWQDSLRRHLETLQRAGGRW